jgi:protein TonB
VFNIVEDDAEIEETTIVSAEDQAEFVEITDDVPIVVEEPEKEEEIFQVVEDDPQFPGGMAELMKFLQKNIKYPPVCQEQGIQGRVIVQFVVNTDGSIVDANVVKSVNPHLDKEALRVVGTMPKWQPGKQRGKAVRVRFTLPVNFRIQN